MEKKTKCIGELEQELEQLRSRVCELEAQRAEAGPGRACLSQSIVTDVFNDASDVIYVKDLDGRYLVINEVGARLLNRTVGECIGKTDETLYPSASAKILRENDLQVISDGEPSMLEEEVVIGAEKITFHTIRSPFRDDQGAIAGVSGISRDITIRKACEETLRLNEERLKLAQQAGQFGTWDWDVVTESGRCSPEYSRLFGFPENGLMPTFDEWLERVHSDDKDRVVHAIFDAHINHLSYHLEYRIVPSEDTVRWVEARASIFTKPDRNSLRVVGVVFDITHQKEEEARLERLVDERTQELRTALIALRRSEKRYRVLFNGIEDGLLVHDLEGHILDCNESLCRQLSYSREELLSMRTREIDDPDFAAGFEARLSTQLKGGTLSCEGVHRTRDGRSIPIDIKSRRMNYLGQDAVLSVTRDISKRKQAERQREALEEQVRHTQKLESMGLLAGGIAHDFNNLLVGVMGHAEMARDSLPDSHDVQDDLEGILAAAERAAGLCNQMLAYSGRGRFVVRVLNVNETFHDISKLLRASVSKKIRVDFDLQNDIPAVEADPAQMTQLILNLLTNAAEAIGDEKGAILIRSRKQYCDRSFLGKMIMDDRLEAGDYVVLSVRDNGSGMDEDTLERIFDPFFTTKFTGRGLGLAAVIGIVRGHNGTMQVKSTVGKGTCFDVYLPASDQLVEEKPLPQREAIANDGEDTILLVDDEPSVLNVARRMLERKGYQVLTATNGQEALDVYRKHAIKGVVLDLTMPELDGRETYAELRRIDPEVRVLISSGYTSQEVGEDFAGYGKISFIQKPFQAEDFYAKMKDVL